MKYKECVSCNISKPTNEFYELRPGYSRSYCKVCDTKRALAWHEANPERRKEIRRNYYQRNKEAIAKQQREYYLANRERINERVRNWTKKDPKGYARKKREYVWSKFGGSYEMFDRLLVEQEGKCGICRSLFTDTNKPQFDHNHDTLTPRGLLCVMCNTNLPYIEDNAFVEAATLYLKKHNEARDKEPVR